MQIVSPLFIDIECASCVDDYNKLSPRMQALWLKKATYLGATTNEEKSSLFFEKGGIFAEFGKVIVIAMGYVTKNASGAEELHVQGLANHDEKALLKRCKTLLNQFPSQTILCGHNSKEFDFPYLCRRMTIHGIRLPKQLDVAGKKPWEVNHLDTMELWKFGDRKNYTSLDLLTAIFGIPSSKEDMAGNEVNTYYYHTKDLPAIEQYCMKDVVATAQLYRKLHFMPLIPMDRIVKKSAGPS